MALGAGRISAPLMQVLDRHAADRAPQGEAGPTVTTRVILETDRGAPVDEAPITARGGRLLYRRPGLAAVTLPTGRVAEAVAALPAVRYARLPLQFQAAAVTSEGLGLTQATVFHDRGYTGEGISVAVIDGGFKGLAAAQAAGELPTTATAVDFTGTGIEASYRHGTGCAEIVHDMAPGASLHLLKVADEIDFTNAVQYCIANGIDIISMSIGVTGSGPGDGTGPMADLVNTARDAGILVVTSAGNGAVMTDDGLENGAHWLGYFYDPDNDGFHNFNSSIDYIAIAAVPDWDDDGAPETDEVNILLRWNDWPVSDVDYDIYLQDYFTGEVVGVSNFYQTGTQPPLERIVLDIPDTEDYAHYYALTIVRNDGSPAGVAMEIHLGGTSRMVPFGANYFFATSASSITEPADAESALAVGAIDIADWAAGPLEDFSSRGPTNAWAGSPARIKPDISGPDGVATTAYGPDGFFGTSASAPHVAGAAAVIWSRYPSSSHSQIRLVVERNAVNMGALGQDNLYGWGRLNLNPLRFSQTVPGLEDGDFGMLISDPWRQRLYVADRGNAELVIVDTRTDQIVDRIAMPCGLDDMAISKEGGLLAVTGGDLCLVSLDTLEATAFHLNADITSAAFDSQRRLYLSSSDSWGFIRRFDPGSGQAPLSFGPSADLSRTVYQSSLVRTDPSGDILYISENHLSPNSLYRMDISGEVPVFLVEDAHGTISIGTDFTVTPDGMSVVSGYQIIDAATITPRFSLSVPGSKKAVAVNDAGTTAYVGVDNYEVYYGNSVYQYVVGTGEYIDTLAVLDHTRYEGVHNRALAFEGNTGKIYVTYGDGTDTPDRWRVTAIETGGTDRVGLEMPLIVSETAGTVSGQIRRPFVPASGGVTVQLTSSRPNQVSVPQTVTIPAGATVIDFIISIVDDGQAGGDRWVTITATGEGFETARFAVLIQDNETGSIWADLPATLPETAGTVNGTLHLSQPAATALTVWISSGNTDAVTTPPSVTVPQGAASVAFDVHVQDNAKIDGAREADLTFAVPGWPKHIATLTVTDDEQPTFAITFVDGAQEGDGEIPQAATITLGGEVVEDMVFTLTAAPSNILTAPGSVTVPAGADHAAFPLTVSEDIFAIGPYRIVIDAAAPGWTMAGDPPEFEIVENWHVGPELPINTFTANAQSTPALAALKDGTLLVAWQSYVTSTDPDIYGQRISAGGERIGGEFRINTETAGGQIAPAVAALAGGGAVVVWQSTDSGHNGIFARQYDGNGTALGPEFAISTVTLSPNQTIRPAADGLSDGGFVVAWQTLSSPSAVAARRFGPSGTPLADAFVIHADPGHAQSAPEITPLSGQRWAAVWQSDLMDGSDFGIFAQIVAEDGTLVGDLIPLDGGMPGNQSLPSVIGTAGGGFAAAWHTVESGGLPAGYAVRRFSADGLPTSPIAVIHQTITAYRPMALSPLPDGGYLAAWEFAGPATNYVSRIHARRFSAEGMPLTTEFRVSSDLTHHQSNAAIAGLSGYVVAAVWQSLNQDGSNFGVYGQILNFDTDRDDDGIADSSEDANRSGFVDAGETDPGAFDTDGDGLSDGLESGLTTAEAGVYTDLNIFTADGDPATTTNPADADTDGDGVSDGIEDINKNGRLDPGELDPRWMCGDVDADGAMTLADAILLLKAANGAPFDPEDAFARSDIDGNGRLGMPEALYLLQWLAGRR